MNYICDDVKKLVDEAIRRAEKDGNAVLELVFIKDVDENGRDYMGFNYKMRGRTDPTVGIGDRECYVMQNLNKLDPSIRIGIVQNDYNNYYRNQLYSKFADAVFLEFPGHVSRALIRGNIRTIGDLQKLNDLKDVLNIRNFGKGRYNKMLEILTEEIRNVNN